MLTPEKALKILQKIPPEHAKLMGFGDNDPSWMIWTVLPIVPPSERPSIQMSPQQKGEDDLTCAAFAIKKCDAEVAKKIAQGCHASLLQPSAELLGFRVGTYTTNEMAKLPKAKQRSGRESQGIVQKIKGKTGLLRANLLGKRVDFSARTVITGDPNISIVQVGVPREIAMTLTVPVMVTDRNRDQCWEMIMKGPNEPGGANTIVKFFKGKRYVTELSLAQDRTDIMLKKGWIIERQLRDGDVVLFNRQPTLHKMGFMGHYVKIVESKTFRLNPSVTSPYNADFDGCFLFFFFINLLTTAAE